MLFGYIHAVAQDVGADEMNAAVLATSDGGGAASKERVADNLSWVDELLQDSPETSNILSPLVIVIGGFLDFWGINFIANPLSLILALGVPK